MEHFIHEIDWKLIGEKMILLKHTSLTKSCVSESIENKEPILDVTAFKSLCAIYAFDLSAQKETIKSNRVDTSLYIERGENKEVDPYYLLLEET